ncbi:hypothetical protein [Brevundimonas sp.]|uniref:hypothetical protein n=1 Tax=Brevundimonas sp. TaxID=1871086 RepID=UPI002D5DECF0|nr:hypothetical protein [Brevundimonas sp.]HYD26986.1 hypothetical protein [Brevundimonas sp.]
MALGLSGRVGARPYDYRDWQAPPAVDPFLVDHVSGFDADSRMTVRGELIVFEGECGMLTVRRLAGPPVVFDEPALTHRARIEAYNRVNPAETCNGAVGEDVALVALDIRLSAEFLQPPSTSASVRPLAGDRVLMWWFANVNASNRQPLADE